MGAGDYLMATAQVKSLYAKNSTPVLVIGADGRSLWHEVFENNPKILRRPARHMQRLVNGPGVRPYIAAKTARQWTWKRWDIQPGEIFLTDAERMFAEPYRGKILIEPNIKGTNEGNKAWVPDRWVQLAATRSDFLQVGPASAPRLRGVQFARTDTFRLACAVMSVARAFVGTEGGLHHAAAALGVPAVVLFGGFISPDITGYPMHHNLFTGGKACGMRVACQHCRDAMSAITVREVAQHLKEILDGQAVQCSDLPQSRVHAGVG